MKCVNSNRHASRLVVSFVTKLERAAHCEKPGVSRGNTHKLHLSLPQPGGLRACGGRSIKYSRGTLSGKRFHTGMLWQVCSGINLVFL
jgi:hypothetical protein